jgi:hypothetical protein
MKGIETERGTQGDGESIGLLVSAHTPRMTFLAGRNRFGDVRVMTPLRRVTGSKNRIGGVAETNTKD